MYIAYNTSERFVQGDKHGPNINKFRSNFQCDPGVGVDRFFHALYTQHLTRMLMLLGSACSEVTESLAKVVPYWNIVQVN